MVRLSSENIFLKDTFNSFHPGLELPTSEKQVSFEKEIFKTNKNFLKFHEKLPRTVLAKRRNTLAWKALWSLCFRDMDSVEKTGFKQFVQKRMNLISHCGIRPSSILVHF